MVLSHRRSISKNAICWLSGSTKSAFYILVAKNDKNYHKRTNFFIYIFIVLEIRAIKAESGEQKAESGNTSKKMTIRIIHPSTLPDWHTYKGEKAWLMIDEVRAE